MAKAVGVETLLRQGGSRFLRPLEVLAQDVMGAETSELRPLAIDEEGSIRTKVYLLVGTVLPSKRSNRDTKLRLCRAVNAEAQRSAKFHVNRRSPGGAWVFTRAMRF